MRQLRIGQSITLRESPSLEKYLQDISKVPMISAEEEVRLADLIRKGDQSALEQLTKANLRFVVKANLRFKVSEKCVCETILLMLHFGNSRGKRVSPVKAVVIIHRSRGIGIDIISHIVPTQILLRHCRVAIGRKHCWTTHSGTCQTFACQQYARKRSDWFRCTHFYALPSLNLRPGGRSHPWDARWIFDGLRQPAH
mgnify:CR=1 FL=1